MERKEKKRRKNAVKIQRKIVINQCKGEAKAPIIMGFPSKDLLHRVTIEPVARQLIPFKDISQLEKKNSSPWYTCYLSLHRVSVTLFSYF